MRHQQIEVPQDATLTGSGAKAAVIAQTVLLFTLTTLPTPLYRDYAREFHFSVLTLTLIYATYVAGTLTSLLFFGRLSDQIGRASVSLPAIGGAAIAALLFVFAHSTAMLFVARLVTGIAAGLSSGTAVAWLRELHNADDAKTASLRTVAVNILGLGLGPLLAGLLSAFAPLPLTLCYAVYLALLVPLAVAVAMTRETVKERRSLQKVSLAPRIGVPAKLRRQFASPGAITFAIFSLVGFYSAIAPSLISEKLHLTSHAAAGAIVFELFFVGAIGVYAAARVSSRNVMLWGAGMMLPALACLVAAEALASLPLLLTGTAFGGVSLGLGYRGTLEVGNQMAPEDKHAELISALFVCGNLGLAVPVIGIGVLSAVSSPERADYVFAAVIALISMGGLPADMFASDGRSRQRT